MSAETAVAVYVEIGHRDDCLTEEIILSRVVESPKASHKSLAQVLCRENALTLL